MASARVARRFLRATNRRSSSAEGYYDSQSGTFISTTKTLRIFEHSASAHAGSGALTQFDASATGARRPATAALLAALGAPHGVDVDALLRDKD